MVREFYSRPSQAGLVLECNECHEVIKNIQQT